MYEIWLITTSKGESGYENQDRRCDIYAKINEDATGATVTVCSGETRHKHLYTTTTNSVEIQIVKTGEEDGDDPTYFAIVYQGIIFIMCPLSKLQNVYYQLVTFLGIYYSYHMMLQRACNPILFACSYYVNS